MIKRSNPLYHTERAEMEEGYRACQRYYLWLLGLADQAVAMKRTQLAETIFTHVPKQKIKERSSELTPNLSPKKFKSLESNPKGENFIGTRDD